VGATGKPGLLETSVGEDVSVYRLKFGVGRVCAGCGGTLWAANILGGCWVELCEAGVAVCVEKGPFPSLKLEAVVGKEFCFSTSLLGTCVGRGGRPTKLGDVGLELAAGGYWTLFAVAL
jgi:hypothetical protein